MITDTRLFAHISAEVSPFPFLSFSLCIYRHLSFRSLPFSISKWKSCPWKKMPVTKQRSPCNVLSTRLTYYILLFLSFRDRFRQDYKCTPIESKVGYLFERCFLLKISLNFLDANMHSLPWWTTSFRSPPLPFFSPVTNWISSSYVKCIQSAINVFFLTGNFIH